jgi:hypothetical protein
MVYNFSSAAETLHINQEKLLDHPSCILKDIVKREKFENTVLSTDRSSSLIEPLIFPHRNHIHT